MVKCEADVPCPQWVAWESWGDCSTTCGAGERTRLRECPSGGCAGNALQSEECNIDTKCPAWSEWSQPTKCSKDCGGGIKLRTRHHLHASNYECSLTFDDAKFISEDVCNTQVLSLKSAPCGQNGVYTQSVQNLLEMELNSEVEIVIMVNQKISQARRSRAVFVIIKNVHDYRTGHIGQLVRSHVVVELKQEHENAFTVQNVMENLSKLLNVPSTMEFVQHWANGLNGQIVPSVVTVERDPVTDHVRMAFLVKRDV